MNEPLRILLADDHPMFRRGLRNVVQLIADVEIVGETATGADTIRMTAELQPDVVVMDLHMPDGDGIEATRQIVRDSPHVGVLILSMFGDDDSVFAAMRAGARGYLLKGADQAEITRAIAAIGAGEAIFGPSIAARVIDYFARPGRSMAAPAAAFPALSERELEVLELIAQGRDNASIATRLIVAPKTIRNHVSNIFTKLQVADRAQAIVVARDAGLGQTSPSHTGHHPHDNGTRRSPP